MAAPRTLTVEEMELREKALRASPAPRSLEKTLTGSGFAVSSKGHILTNHHVVETLLERLEYVLERVPPILQALEADTDEFGMESPDDFFEQLREECRTRLMKSIETGQREWQRVSLAEAVSEEG